MSYTAIILLTVLCASKADFRKNTAIYTYDGLITHLTNGARVMFFFNTTTCQPISQTRVSDLPVFGGEINFFLATKISNDTTGQLIFNHDGYAFDSSNEDAALTEEIESVYIMNTTAFILYGSLGFFDNSSDNVKGVICDWTSGKGNKFWAREQLTPRHLNSSEQIRTMLVNGNPLRFAIVLDGCQCVKGNCGHGYIGGKVAGVKISTDGTISFSNAMTLFLPNPASPMSFRELLVGSIHSNNTITLMLSYEKMPTPDIEIACSIEAVRRHADFFSIE